MAAQTGRVYGAEPVEITISKKRLVLYDALIFVIFLVLLEGALRLAGIPASHLELRNDGGLVQPADNSIGYEYASGWSGYHAGARVRTNSLGWRGREFSIQKPEGTIRILGIGDSFTLGRAVEEEDTYLEKLAQMFNTASVNRYETINAGHENVNTADELRYFKEREMMKLKPDVVVLGFTVHNDAELSKNGAKLRRHKREAALPLRVAEGEWFKGVASSCRIAALLRDGVKLAYRDEISEFYFDLILSNYAEGSESWETCRQALLGFYEVCRANRVPLVVVIFPVYTRRLSDTYRDYPEDFKIVHERLRAVYASKDGAVVVDPLDDLAASGLSMSQMRVSQDGHPNRVWHEIVARRLYDTIKSLGLESKVSEPGAPPQ